MNLRFFSISALIILLVCGCSPTKHVPKGEYLLDRVKITVDDKRIRSSDLKPYLRQTPNHKTFGIIGLPLALYNLSGSKDNRWNRFMQRIGTPPVVYDSLLTEKSVEEIEKAMSNSGFMEARVEVDTVTKKRKLRVTYNVKSGEPYVLRDVTYNIPDDSLAGFILRDTAYSVIKKGALFDHSLLDQERQRITARLKNRGYYAFNKEFITFAADTTVGNHMVDLELNLLPFPVADTANSDIAYVTHKKYRIRDVSFITEYNPMNIDQRHFVADTVLYDGFTIYYGEKQYLRPSVLVNNCFIRPGQMYSTRNVDNTLTAFGRLRVLKYVNIQFMPIKGEDGEMYLDCYIMLTEGKTQTISTELEGTNSAGDFGFAIGVNYQHRNIFRGSQTFNTKVRAAYESISGDVGGLISNNYLELGLEAGISFPKYIFPFAKEKSRQRLRPTTDLTLNGNFQQRPEYIRIIAGAGWGYKWYSHYNMFRHKLDLIDINYIYLPKTTAEFKQNIDELSVDNPMLRYSYEDHFIMRMAYAFYMSNLRPSAINQSGNIYTLRTVTEIAGNLLYGISCLTDPGRPESGYSILGIRYAQYFKQDIDYTYTFVFNEKNSLAIHAGAGIAIPYGNSEMLPFEKRYFSGGANSVRGWSVRDLGPGNYQSMNPTADFMNQCGDIRIDLNIEYRSKLIWKLELAAFIDAGNIWTIRSYDSQPGGVFKFNTFYKQLAMAYGLGLRLDFNYFILRLDLGMKLYNPAVTGKSKWVITYQNFQRDAALHFAIGYPF